MSQNSRKIMVLAASLALLCSACHEENKGGTEVIPCLADNTCEDASRVCINGLYCVPRCKPDSCDEGYTCAENGICTPESNPQNEPECSDEKKCTGANQKCVSGHCVASSGACSGSQKCSKDSLYCVDGSCVPASGTVSCENEDACGDGKVCDGGKCVDKCETSDGCTNHRACDTNSGKCVEKCYLNGCPSGYACNNDGLCVEGECTSWTRCYENGFDRSYVCDVPNRKCIPVCTAGSCGEGKYCDSEDSLCHEGECSEVDQCSGNTVCDLGTHTCIAKCTSNDACNGLLCDVDGRCVSPCSVGTCPDGKACDPESKLCIEAECSAVDGCSLSYQVCDAGKCVDRCTMSGATCASDKVCDKNSGICIPRCTAYSCGEGKVCGNDGQCVTGECSKLEACAGENAGKVCSAGYTCVKPIPLKNDCYFYSTCALECADSEDARCSECRARSKWCPDGQQCNALNTCISEDDADGVGLGLPCDNSEHKCASDLYCDSKQNVCLQKAYQAQGTTCTAGSYTDHCEGNLIVECSETYSQVMVYDCKTQYLNWDLGTTGKFYGDDFVCAKRPGTRFVACAQLCDAAAVASEDTKYVCGYDLDDFDIDYSDKFVCEYNQDGISAYFNEASEQCWYGCSYENGMCDRY